MRADAIAGIGDARKPLYPFVWRQYFDLGAAAGATDRGNSGAVRGCGLPQKQNGPAEPGLSSHRLRGLTYSMVLAALKVAL